MNHEFHRWMTPDGPLEAAEYERYIGLRGQVRVGLVDRMGRVFHYDRRLLSRSASGVQIVINNADAPFDPVELARHLHWVARGG